MFSKKDSFSPTSFQVISKACKSSPIGLPGRPRRNPPRPAPARRSLVAWYQEAGPQAPLRSGRQSGDLSPPRAVTIPSRVVTIRSPHRPPALRFPAPGRDGLRYPWAASLRAVARKPMPSNKPRAATGQNRIVPLPASSTARPTSGARTMPERLLAWLSMDRTVAT